eukprot:COSAG04_NODE_1872_length_5345_cov_10.328250_5_plen_228_part_00
MGASMASAASASSWWCDSSSSAVAKSMVDGWMRMLCPPVWRSKTMSEAGMSTALRKCASCSASLPSLRPGITLLKFVPSGHSRTQPALAAMEMVGTMMSRPCSWAGSTAWASRRSATCPSYSLPWFPASSRAVRPGALPATTQIGTRVEAMMEGSGTSRWPQRVVPGPSPSSGTVIVTGPPPVGGAAVADGWGAARGAGWGSSWRCRRRSRSIAGSIHVIRSNALPT